MTDKYHDTSSRVVGICAENRTKDLPHTRQECQLSSS